MRGLRCIALSLVAMTGIASFTACGTGEDSKTVTLPTGAIIFSACVENGTVREVSNLNATTGKIEWKRYFNLDESAGINSIAKCGTPLTGAEQNAAFDDYYRKVLATQAVPNGEAQYVGWLPAEKHPSAAKTPGGIFASGIDRGLFLPGAYDGAGQGTTYYGQNDPASNRDVMMAYDGLSGKQVGETPPGEPQMVYLPVGSHRPQFTSSGIDGYTAFKGDFGFSSLHKGVRYGTSEQIFGGDAKIATMKNDAQAPRVIKVLSKDRYIGFNSDGIYDVRRKGGALEAKRLYNGKSNIGTAVAGPDNSVVFVLNGPPKEDFFAYVDIYVMSLDGGEPHKVKTFKNWEGELTLMAFRHLN